MNDPARPDGGPGDPALHEARRQQWLLQVLRGEAGLHTAPGWLAGPPLQQQRGLRAYQANAAATATRALASAYPTVQQLVGDMAFAALAQALWQAQPPERGDLAAWGAGLPSFMADDAQLAAVPYLPDLARLDWALHAARQAADDDGPVAGLALLGSGDPAQLRLRLRAGHAVLVSAHPVHTIWSAHRSDAQDRFQAARSALARGEGQCVRVRRQGLEVVAEPIDAAAAAFEAQLLRGATLDAAMTDAAPGFDVEAWLIDSLRQGRLAAVLSGPSA